MSQSVLRGLDVLAFLAARGEPATVQQIADGTRMSKATAYRVVDELEKGGWLRPTGAASRPGLTFKLVELGIAALRHNRVRDVILPNAIELARVTGRTVFVGFYEDGDIVYTDVLEVIADRVMPMLQGTRAPAASTASGKILLALQEPDEVARVVARGLPQLTRNTKTAPTDIAAEIELCRERGYGIAHDEVGPGTGGLAVPVFDHTGEPVAALGVDSDGPPSDGFIEQVLPRAKPIAARASIELGYRSVARTAV